MQGMYELVSSLFLFTTHTSYCWVLTYSCEAIKKIHVYVCLFFLNTHIRNDIFSRIVFNEVQ